MLIAIAIIGIVATLTIPQLVVNYQKHTSVTKLRETYSILQQAMKMYTAENGIEYTSFNTQLSPEVFMKTYINPYIKILGECKSTTECYGNRIPLAIDSKTQLTIDYVIKLTNDSYLGVYSLSGGAVFYIDINGNKKPNRSGRDIFYFFLINSNSFGKIDACTDIVKNFNSGIYPGGCSYCWIPFPMYTRAQLLSTNIDRGCNKQLKQASAKGGDACATVIVLDGWKIKNDYPW